MAHPKRIRITSPRPSVKDAAKKLGASKADVLKVSILGEIYSLLGRVQSGSPLPDSKLKRAKEELAKRMAASAS